MVLLPSLLPASLPAPLPTSLPTSHHLLLPTPLVEAVCTIKWTSLTSWAEELSVVKNVPITSVMMVMANVMPAGYVSKNIAAVHTRRPVNRLLDSIAYKLLRITVSHIACNIEDDKINSLLYRLVSSHHAYLHVYIHIYIHIYI